MDGWIYLVFWLGLIYFVIKPVESNSAEPTKFNTTELSCTDTTECCEEEKCNVMESECLSWQLKCCPDCISTEDRRRTRKGSKARKRIQRKRRQRRRRYRKKIIQQVLRRKGNISLTDN